MYHYTDCGLQNVYLRSGFVMRETEFGEAVSIHNLQGLHKAISHDIAEKESALTGDEVRFLRKELDLTQVSLANIICVSEDTLRGWENARINISPPADKLIRLLYLSKVNGNSSVCSAIEEIGRLNREIAEAHRMNFEENENGWHQVSDAA